jgi:hypothetical protein
MIDVSRHRSVFEPTDWNPRRVDVIGVGATGSRVAYGLAKLGVTGLHVWDHDSVEPHNLANQMYGLGDIGRRKTEALSRRIFKDTGTTVTQHGEWTPGAAVGEVVFALVDSMAVRSAIFDSYRYNSVVRLIIDTRLGADSGFVLCYRPATSEAARYQATLYSDEDAITEVSACGTAITVPPTADIVSGYAVWEFIRHVEGRSNPDVAHDPELAIGAREPALNVL